MAMAIAAFCSCSSSSAALPQMGLELSVQRMRRTRNQPSGRKSVVPYDGKRAMLRNGSWEKFVVRRDSVRIRAVAAGDDGEEVEESERPKTVSSKTRPKSMSSTIQKPAALGSEKRARENLRSPNIISALVEDIAGFMAPREKGDIRDVMLMSFSFALFIYISQHLVHAYCMLRHTSQPFHHF